MILELDPQARPHDVTTMCERVAVHDDLKAWPLVVAGRQFIIVSGDESLVPDIDHPTVLGRHSTAATGYWLVSSDNEVAPSVVTVGDSHVGDPALWCAAGPCALEDVDDAIATGRAVRDQGANALRIGVFKPRTSPYNFQGKEREGIRKLVEVKEAVGLPIVTEVLDPRDVDPLAEVADCLQVGTRNMTNQALLKALGTAERPVLLKRGMHAPVVEWLRAAEFIAAHGNPNVILCARGIASFDTSLRAMPDLGAIAEARRSTPLPIVFDPSHAAGRGDRVAQVALAAAAFGIDGLLVEAHCAPERMHQPGDGGQAYPPADLADLLAACAAVRQIAANLPGRTEERAA